MAYFAPYGGAGRSYGRGRYPSAMMNPYQAAAYGSRLAPAYHSRHQNFGGATLNGNTPGGIAYAPWWPTTQTAVHTQPGQQPTQTSLPQTPAGHTCPTCGQAMPAGQKATGAGGEPPASTSTSTKASSTTAEKTASEGGTDSSGVVSGGSGGSGGSGTILLAGVESDRNNGGASVGGATTASADAGFIPAEAALVDVDDSASDGDDVDDNFVAWVIANAEVEVIGGGGSQPPPSGGSGPVVMSTGGQGLATRNRTVYQYKYSFPNANPGSYNVTAASLNNSGLATKKLTGASATVTLGTTTAPLYNIIVGGLSVVVDCMGR